MKELQFSITLELKYKILFDQNCEKNEILIFTKSCYYYKSKHICISFQFSFFFSIILKKILKLCNNANHSKVSVTFS